MLLDTGSPTVDNNIMNKQDYFIDQTIVNVKNINYQLNNSLGSVVLPLSELSTISELSPF